MRPHVLAAWIATAALLAGCAAEQPSRWLYQWTDASGSVRYTAFPARIPADREHTRERVLSSEEARRAGALASIEIPATAPPPQGADPGAAREVLSPLDARIAELEAQIAADEETLKALISDPKMADTLRSNPELRKVGERLPGLQAELEELRAERDGS